MTKIVKGTTFFAIYQDGNCKWEAIEYRGGNAWTCKVTHDNPDYVGVTKVFGTEEIEAAIAKEDFWGKIIDDNETWWSSMTVGETVHYDNGFGCYVRGTIVDKNGEKRMLPTALVGNWKLYDLPRVMPDGTVSLPYHARDIFNGTTSRPNFSNMYELKLVDSRWSPKGDDPRTMPEIDIAIPTLSAEQIEAKRLNGIISALDHVMNDRHKHDGLTPSEKFRQVLLTVKQIVNSETI